MAAARPIGRIDQYADSLPDDPRALLSQCTLSMVDLGTVSANDPVKRAAQVRAVDAQLAKVVQARPKDSLLLVAGLSDTDSTSRLHVAIADGPGYGSKWLTSSGTGRSGYVQLIDLAPTILTALGVGFPPKLFHGTQIVDGSARPADPAVAVARLADSDHEGRVQHDVATWFFWALVIFETILLLICVPLLRRARRSAEPHGPPPVAPSRVRLAEFALMVGALGDPGCAAGRHRSVVARRPVRPAVRDPDPGRRGGGRRRCALRPVAARHAAAAARGRCLHRPGHRLRTC